MKSYIKSVRNRKSTVTLFVFSCFCLLLSVFRVLKSNDLFFVFLVWNLFLAFVPWLLSSFLLFKKIKSTVLFWLLWFIWLLFFPNAPYILTDMIHLRITAYESRWMDFILILSYSFCGLFYAFVSLNFVEQALTTRFNIKRPYIFSVIILYLSGFGIYLGRFLRWNSWDLFSNLLNIVDDVFDRIANPFEHLDVWVFTFILGSLLNIMYWTYRSFSEKREN